MIRKRINLRSLLIVALLVGSMVIGVFMTSSVISASSLAYSSSKITISQGQLVSGNNASLGSKDSSFLVINSVANGSYYVTDWYAEFTLPSRQVTNLSISYTGKYSAWRGQNLFLYNFSTATWQNINYTNIGQAGVSVDIPVVNSASYVSADGKVWLRSYCVSTGNFAAYTDYLMVGATFADATPTPTPMPTPTPTPTPTLTTTPAPAPVSGDYYSTGITVNGGQLVSGNNASLGSKDSSFLVINSVANGSYYVTDWYAEFTLPNQQVTNLSISYTGKYSTWRGQNLFLYNFSTATWQSINYANIGAAGANIDMASVGSPASFVSAEGKVLLRVYCASTGSFTAYTDCLKLGITY